MFCVEGGGIKLREFMEAGPLMVLAHGDRP